MKTYNNNALSGCVNRAEFEKCIIEELKKRNYIK